jgi:hypothetical protein
MNEGRDVSYKYCRIKTSSYMDINKMTGRVVKYCKNKTDDYMVSVKNWQSDGSYHKVLQERT